MGIISYYTEALLPFLKEGLQVLFPKVRSFPIFQCLYISVFCYTIRRFLYKQGYITRGVRIGGRVVYMNSAEALIAEGIVDTDKIEADFSSVGGLENVKEALIEHVKWPLTRPELFRGKTLRSHPRGVLLYGPPGTGKTLLARALAKELGCTFIGVKTESIFSKWVGETEKNAAAVFTLAEKLSPCVIFIDEVDAILGFRSCMDSAPHTHAKTIFLTHWDGIQAHQGKILVIGATNRIMSIDDAALRRLPLRLEVPPPSEEDRKKILSILLSNDLEGNPQKDELIDELVLNTNGYTGSDLTELCKAAVLMPLREMDESSILPPLAHRHFKEALKRFKPSMKV